MTRRYLRNSRGAKSLSAAASGVFDRLADLLRDPAVMLFGQCMPGRNRQGDRPVENLDGGQHAQGTVVREVLRTRYPHSAHHRQVNAEGLRLGDPLDGVTVARAV